MTGHPEQEGKEQPRHIELNFGPSVYVIYRPINHVEPDMVVTIPTRGPLKTLPYRVLNHFMQKEDVEAVLSHLNPRESGQSFSSVEFPMFNDYRNGYRVANKIIMPWIGERGEWVALHYSKGLEVGAPYDESYSGPFELNGYCKRVLARAYRADKEQVPGDIAKINPDTLERLFDDRRRFGIQLDHLNYLEQRLKDPSKSLSVVVDRWLAYGLDATQRELIDGTRLLLEQINTGIADDQLIPVLDAFISKAGPMKEGIFKNRIYLYRYLGPGSSTDMGYSLYSDLISGTNSIKGIPYLLQALQSSFVVLSAEPYERSIPVLVGETFREERQDEEMVTVLYGQYHQRNKYHSRKPYAELAKLRLQNIARSFAGDTDSDNITKAITKFEATKPLSIELEESFETPPWNLYRYRS